MLHNIKKLFESKEEEKKEQENEKRIKNIIREELENLTKKNNSTEAKEKTAEKVDERGV